MEPSPRGARRPRVAPLRAAYRHGLAADLLQRAHRGGPRRARRLRARGGRRHRRAASRWRSGPPPRPGAVGGCRSRDGERARARHPDPPGPAADRLRRRRPPAELARALGGAALAGGATAARLRSAVAAEGLALALATPLGGALGGSRSPASGPRTGSTSSRSSCRWPAATSPSASVGVAGSAGCSEQLLPADDPLAGYAQRLRDPMLAAALRGYLTGSIDLVLRVGDAGGRDRYAIIDYKTNWLAPAGEPWPPGITRPRRWPSRCSAPTTCCRRSSTRWRCTATCAGGLPGYDPDTDCSGFPTCSCAGCPDPRTDRGVLLAAAGGLVVALSDLLAGKRSDERPAERTGGADRARPVRRRACPARPRAARRVQPCRGPGRRRRPCRADPCSLARIGVEEPRGGSVLLALRLPCGRRGSAASSSTCRRSRGRSPSRTRSCRSRRCRGPTSPTGLRRCRPRRGWWRSARTKPPNPAAAAARLAALPRPLLARGASAGAGADGARGGTAGESRPRRARRGGRPDLPDDDGDLMQRIAAASAVLRGLTVIAGGPGTGKTTTVARIVALVANGAGEQRLAAPAGRAVRPDRQGGRAAAGGGRRRGRPPTGDRSGP